MFQRERFPGHLMTKYTLLQSAYWMAYVTIYSFAVEFLLAKGFDAAAAGTILAVSSVVSCVTQPSLAALSERRGRPGLAEIVMGGVALALCLSVALNFACGPVTAVLFGALAAIMQALLPFENAIAFAYINRGGKINYGLARAIGSAMFAVLSSVLGLYVMRLGGQRLPILYIALLICLAAAAWIVGEPKGGQVRGESAEPTPLREFATRYRRFCFLLAGLTCLLFEHSIINSYLTQIFEGVGGSSVDKGVALAVAAVSELPTMGGFALLTKRFSIRSLMRFATAFMSLKAVWFLLASSVPSLYAAHVTQMFSYALYIPASVYYVNHVMAARDRVKGVALINVPMTLGSVFGTLVGGWLLRLAGLRVLLTVSTTVSILGSLIAFFSLEKVREE